MNKIKRRAFILTALVLLLIGGVCFYLYSYVAHGAEWVDYPSNKHLYSGGQPLLGTIYDRNGEILAQSVDGKRLYHEDAEVRRAMLHLIGDNAGKIGAGVQSKFSKELTGFSLVSGLFNKNTALTSVKLTADADISRAAYEALAGYKGAVVAYNYKTGAMLCAVSSPNFDPNNIPDDLEENPSYSGVYINRCFGATYTPGSVMKVVTSMAAIEKIDDIFEQKFVCEGSCYIDGKKITCQNTHGTIDFKTALAKSCNCAFAEIAQQLGAETLIEYFKRAGLADSMNINGIYSPAGRIDNWEDNPNELAWAGIGQSTNLVTPVAMMRLMGGIANGGKAVNPKLVHSLGVKQTELMPASTAEKLTEMMRNATETVYGDSSFPDVLNGYVCAKSGTAQIDGETSNSWFCGFVATDRYPCAFAVIAEHAGAGSGVAKEIAARVLTAVVED